MSPVASSPSDPPPLLPLAIVDDAGRILHWSPGCETLYGWDATAAVGAIKHELLHSSRDGERAPWPVAVSTARPLDEVDRDGRRVRVIELVMPLPSPDCHAIFVIRRHAGADAGADDGADDIFRVAQARRLSAIGTFSYDMAEQRIAWSHHHWRSREGDAGTSSLAELKIGRLGAAYERVAAFCREDTRDGGDYVELDVPVQGRDVSIRTLRCQIRLVRDGDGKLTRLVGVTQDITPPNLRERTLRDRQAQLKEILDAVSDAIIVVGRHGAIASLNRAAQALLGHDDAALVDRPIAVVIEGGWPVIESALGHGGPSEMIAILASGARLSVELRAGSLPGYMASRHILVFTDISERKAKEARRTLFEHTARDIAMAEYAVHLMHELNQPLAAASNFLAVARHLAHDVARLADVGEMIDMALGQIQRLGGVIRSTQRKATGEDIVPRVLPVRATVEEAVALVGVAHGAGGVDIAIQVDADATTMFVDPVGIQQVLANLLRNAIEAFGPSPRVGARIDVRSHRTDRRFLLSVCDNGPGIPVASLADLFEPFQHRAKRTGMGLGLSICRTLAEAHGGTLTAENMSSGGACFTLTLPLDDRDGPA